jgi:translocation and assembly module TamA
MKTLICQPDGSFLESELYDALGLKQPSWYEFWKDKHPKINAKLTASFYESLQNFYKSQGFYHANIQKEETNTTITFRIKKGAVSSIVEIQSDLEPRYNQLITFHKKDRFRATQFIEIKQAIKKKLLEDGYCNANFDAKARVDIEKNIVFLSYHLQKNQQCRFGAIMIKAPDNIAQKVIRSRLNFQEGSTYSSKLIKESYSTISGLEAFDGVQISQKKVTDVVNLNINLKKKAKRIRQEIGVGYETNLGPKGIFRWEERNFKGDARKVSFDLKYSNKEKYIKNAFFWPAFMHLPYKERFYLDLKNEFLYSKYAFENFDEAKLADYLHLLKDYHYFAVDMGLGLEKISIKKTGEICNVSEGNFLLFFPFLNLIIDTRDSKINPKNGLYLSLYLESGLKYIASSTSYSKFIAEARFIQSRHLFTFAAKGKLGLISEFQKYLPESKRFFAGGAFSNRAYGYNRLGARDSMCDEVGGKTLIDTTLEVSHPIYKNIDAALFYDATMISLKSFEFTIDFIHAVGFGFRYHTPIGPVKIDLGVNVEDKNQYALHFQIGQSF